VIIIGCILYIVYLGIATFKLHHPAISLVFAIVLAITFILFIFYIIDRLIVKRVNYWVLCVVESVFILLFGVYFFFPENTIDINVATNKDYILVIFDSEAHLLEDFEPKRIVGKTLTVSENIIHVDSSLHHNLNFVIREPEAWNGFNATEGTVQLNGKTVHYTLLSNHKHRQLTIDSLWEDLHAIQSP